VTQPDPHFEALLLHLKEARGFNFTGAIRLMDSTDSTDSTGSTGEPPPPPRENSP
jgi:hypothetical protein